MLFLARSLDDEQAQPCGRCASCLGRPVIPEEFSHQLAVAAALYLRHAELPLECKKQVASGAFIQYGFSGNLPPNLRAETGRILSRWGDAGWGRIVAEDKHNNHFRDELVEAVVEMIRERWRPSPAPTWIACVPSRNHPNLVPDFARRLAARLHLPFHEAITKVRDNQQQKLQQNRYHQCRNLDGVFDVAADIPNGPVLLVDDMVDSAWTMTVVAALMRLAGSGPVWPVALASTSSGD
jgi:ATP-dependent DNA helicase RecQ